MSKSLIFSFIAACLLYCSCSKSNKSDIKPQNIDTLSIKIELVSGGGQIDTIGNSLPSPVVVKITKNGIPVSGYPVQFQASGCNKDDIVSTFTYPDGTAEYNWSLAGDVGQQSLKAYILNSNNQKIDSVKAIATGLAIGPGWHNSGCSMYSSSGMAFCKLSTGRLFTCFLGKTYLRYSDDNGISWNAVKSLGNSHAINYVFSGPSDELFVLTDGNDGTFYSSDDGETWSNLGVAPFHAASFPTAVCTSGGILMVTTGSLPPLYISLDKGKTWSTINNSAFLPQNNNSPLFNNPIEDKDGNLYVVEQQNGNIFKSTDQGKTWNLVAEIGYNSPGDAFSLYIDNNNWFYKSTVQFQPGIYVSKDNGNNYNMLIPYSPFTAIENMSVQSDGNFYYEDIGRGLYSFDGNSPKLIYGYEGTFVQPYIVAKNNNIIFANLGNGHIRYYTK